MAFQKGMQGKFNIPDVISQKDCDHLVDELNAKIDKVRNDQNYSEIVSESNWQ